MLLERTWYQSNLLSTLLAPLAYLFGLIVRWRQFFYRKGFLVSQKAQVPVIVIGNISVGGNGKTPLVISLTEFFRQQGFHPGIVSRGYGGKAKQYPKIVTANDKASEVGDEALLFVKRCHVPVAIAPKRNLAVKALIQQGCDLILSDDGLQHYAMDRDIEIVVIDGERRHGNQKLLPAGPLREPISRLEQVDFIVNNGSENENEITMQLLPQEAVNLKDPNESKPLTSFAGQTCHAVAGIGNPQRFFNLLNSYGLKITPHAMPDHHLFTAEDFDFADDLPILITEKDAVKCQDFADQRFWMVPVTAKLPETFFQQLLSRLKLNP